MTVNMENQTTPQDRANPVQTQQGEAPTSAIVGTSEPQTQGQTGIIDSGTNHPDYGPDVNVNQPATAIVPSSVSYPFMPPMPAQVPATMVHTGPVEEDILELYQAAAEQLKSQLTNLRVELATSLMRSRKCKITEDPEPGVMEVLRRHKDQGVPLSILRASFHDDNKLANLIEKLKKGNVVKEEMDGKSIIVSLIA